MQRSQLPSIDRILLTGAFGANIDPQNAAQIGLLPENSTVNRLELVENAAGLGAVAALLDKGRREELTNVIHQIRPIELSADPIFTEEFIKAIPFPRLTT